MSKTYISALLVALLAAAQVTAAETTGTGPATSAAESEMVSWLLDQGIAQYNDGKYHEAITMLDGVLAIDKYHAKAIRLREKASNKIAAKEGRKEDSTRAKAMADISAAWNPEPKLYGAVALSDEDAAATPRQLAIEATEANMRAITIPSLDFVDAHVEDVILFLSAAGRRFSAQGKDVDVALLGMDRVADDSTVSISFADMNLYEALLFVVEMTSLKFEVGPNVVAVMPANYVPLSQMVTQAYDVSPDVGTDLESAGGSGGDSEDLFGDSFASESSTDPIDVTGFFSVVDFPEGSSAVYQPRFHKLFVKNTQKSLKALETVLAGLEEEAVKRRSQQVEIEAKFVEFSEGALEELGFDWTVYGSGSVAGFEGLSGDYFKEASGYQQATPVANSAAGLGGSIYTDPASGQQYITTTDGRMGQNVFGSAQRDNVNVYDPVIAGLVSTMGGTPAAMVFSNGDVDLRITAMEQQGTADILSAPKVTTKSGAEALIRIAETHRYPQDYIVETGQRTAPIVKPQDWENYDMGVSLKVTPVVDTDNNTIDLVLHPQILSYKGFDAYLVALNAYDAGTGNIPVPGGDGSPLYANMAYFERRSAQTQVTVGDGQTVVIGGLVNERTETFRDQVPLLGDIPYLGRLFRTEGSRTSKINLTSFVKATLIDPRGMTRAERELARQAAAK
jgi:general secretion pathway protein D